MTTLEQQQQLETEKILDQQSNAVQHSYWIKNDYTRKFISTLIERRKSVILRMENLSFSSNTENINKLQSLGNESRTLNEIIEYAQTGNFR